MSAKNLAVDSRRPVYIQRVPKTRVEVAELLAQRITVTSVAELGEARVRLARNIATAFNRDRSEVKIPQGAYTLYRGVNLTVWAEDQAERVRAGNGAAFQIFVSGRVVRGVLAAWDRMQGAS